MCADPSGLPELLQAVIAGFAVLGGAMALVSGMFASLSVALRMPAYALAHSINLGIAAGFVPGALFAIFATMISLGA